MNIKWDANKYTADFSFVHQYGNSVIELIDADKGSSVLDLGCGNGELTKVLQDKGYLVKGLDASKELLVLLPKHRRVRGHVRRCGVSSTICCPF